MWVELNMRLLCKVAGVSIVASVLPSMAFAFPTPVAVPEPATLTLIASGLGGSAGIYAIGKWLRRK
jgi:hypothetical protein